MSNAFVQTVLVVTGVLTAGLAVGVIAPVPLLKLLVNLDSSDWTLRLIARHWSLVVACVGLLLIGAAFDPALRTAAMAFAMIEKLAFAALVLPTPLRHHRFTMFAVTVDTLMVILYIAILVR